MSILNEFGKAARQGVSNLYFNGFEDAVSTVFYYLEHKKKSLNLKVRDGQYLTNEEQYLLAQIDLFIEELYEEFNSTASTKGPKI